MHYLLNERVADVRGAKEVALIAHGASQSSHSRSSYDDTQHGDASGGASQPSHSRSRYDDNQYGGRSQSSHSRSSYDDNQYGGRSQSSHSRSSYDDNQYGGRSQSSHLRSSYDGSQSSTLSTSTPVNTPSRSETLQAVSTPRSVETLRSPAVTSTNRRPPYMHQIKLASTKGKLGVHHPNYKDDEEEDIAGVVVKAKKVPFSDLEFGFLANWKRSDLANLVNYRLLPEVLGDNTTSRL